MPEPLPEPPPGASPSAYIIVRGETMDGKKFRPSDWCDRLYNTLQVLGDEAEACYEYVHLVNLQNAKCIVIDKGLENYNSRLYSFLLRFCADNRLAVNEVSEQQWTALHGA